MSDSASETQDPAPTEAPSTPRKSRAPLLGILAVVAAAVLAGGIYLAVYAGQPDLREDLTSGDVDRMRLALANTETESLRGQEAHQTRQLTIEAMSKMPVADLMALWQDESLSQEQRRQMAENMRVIMMSYMTDFAEEYFSAPPQDKEALLDKRMDEWKEFMDRMREYNEAHKDDPEYQKRREQERERRREQWRRRSKEDRKQQMAEMTPDQQAKMMYVWTQMQKRAKERGMDMGWGRGRGRGDDRDGDRRDRPRRDRRRDRD